MYTNSVRINNLNLYQLQVNKKKETIDNPFKINIFNEPENDNKDEVIKKNKSDAYIPQNLNQFANNYVFETAQINRNNQSKNFSSVQTANYDIGALDQNGISSIYNKQGQRLGSFCYDDIYIRRDEQTGKEFLISGWGSDTGWYDAILLNSELNDALAKAMGVQELPVHELEGYAVKTHAETGIQYLIADNEVGKGGKVLIQSGQDQKKLEALANEYKTKYPNLVKDDRMALGYAEDEIRGLSMRTGNGIITINFSGMNYSDNTDSTKNWSVLFDDQVNTYNQIMKLLENRKYEQSETEKFSFWMELFDNIDAGYERIWSKVELKQGYLYQ